MGQGGGVWVSWVWFGLNFHQIQMGTLGHCRKVKSPVKAVQEKTANENHSVLLEYRESEYTSLTWCAKLKIGFW